jgi:hypothetical protein
MSVSYRKPAKNGHFKKGQSGNPKGRPKKAARAGVDGLSLPQSCERKGRRER